MRKAISIYVDDDNQLTLIHAAVVTAKGEENSIHTMSLNPVGVDAVYIPFNGDIMAVAENQDIAKKVTGTRKRVKKEV